MALQTFSNTIITSTLTTSTNVYAVCETPQAAYDPNAYGFLITAYANITGGASSNTSATWTIAQGQSSLAVVSNAVATTAINSGTIAAPTTSGHFIVWGYGFVPNWAGQFQAAPTGSTSAFIPVPNLVYTLVVAATFTGTAPTVNDAFISVTALSTASIS
jgi:hypothetical protein